MSGGARGLTVVSSLDVAVLALRLGLALILYAFVVAVMRAAGSAWAGVDAPVAVAAPRQRPAPRSEAAALRLQVLEPGATAWDPGEVVTVSAAGTMGRSGENAVVVPDSTVSGRHAQLRYQGRAWSVADLDSTNGTRVGGHLLPPRSPVPLRAGETLALGSVQFQVL